MSTVYGMKSAPPLYLLLSLTIGIIPIATEFTVATGSTVATGGAVAIGATITSAAKEQMTGSIKLPLFKAGGDLKVFNDRFKLLCKCTNLAIHRQANTLLQHLDDATLSK